MNKKDLSDEAIKALEILKRRNDEENYTGPLPAPETALAQELVGKGLIERDTRPFANQPGKAIVGHTITDKGRRLLCGEEV